VVVAKVFGVPGRAVVLVVLVVLVVERATRVVGEPDRPEGLPPQAARTRATAAQHAPTRAQRPVRSSVVLNRPAAA
jgi:hypothetical protein